MNLGGSLSRTAIFRNILSIGYELEVPSLSKFTYDKDEDILVNTDLNVGRMREIEFFEEDEDEYEAEKKAKQQIIKEIEIKDCRITPTILNPNINDDLNDETKLLIQISTDAVTNPKDITSIFKDFCELYEMQNKDLFDVDNEEYDENDNKMNEESKKRNREIIKDKLYQFKILENNEYTKSYKINFFHHTQKECYKFTDVEFIATYYAPKTSHNLILDTFSNAIGNIIAYIDSLEIQKGSLFVLHKSVDKTTDEYELVEYPKIRNLLIDPRPNSSVRYIDMHLSRDSEKTLNDTVIIPQMTFSCKIENAFLIMKELLRLTDISSTKRFNHFISDTIININFQFGLLNRIEELVNQLFEKYNEQYNPKFTIDQINQMKNYLGLIFYKMYKYYNVYLPKSRVSNTTIYFKDSLGFNSRHVNVQLYNKLKQKIVDIIENDDTIINKNATEIIQNLIFQPTILMNVHTGLIDNIKNIRKNGFEKTNILEKSNRNYGNPFYSLRSYFDYFENPIEEEEDVIENVGGKKSDEDNIAVTSEESSLDDSSEEDSSEEDSQYINEKEYETILVNDWLFKNNIDSFSSTSDIKNDIILIEVRSFVKLLAIHFATQDPDYETRIKKLDLYFYKRFLEIYNKKRKKVIGGKKINKTKNNHKNKNKNQKNTKKYKNTKN